MGRQILYHDDLLGAESKFFMSPGNYSIDIILDKENDDDFDDGIIVDMNYLFDTNYATKDVIVKDVNGNPVSLLFLSKSDFREIGVLKIIQFI